MSKPEVLSPEEACLVYAIYTATNRSSQDMSKEVADYESSRMMTFMEAMFWGMDEKSTSKESPEAQILTNLLHRGLSEAAFDGVSDNAPLLGGPQIRRGVEFAEGQTVGAMINRYVRRYHTTEDLTTVGSARKLVEQISPKIDPESQAVEYISVIRQLAHSKTQTKEQVAEILTPLIAENNWYAIAYLLLLGRYDGANPYLRHVSAVLEKAQVAAANTYNRLIREGVQQDRTPFDQISNLMQLMYAHGDTSTDTIRHIDSRHLAQALDPRIFGNIPTDDLERIREHIATRQKEVFGQIEQAILDHTGFAASAFVEPTQAGEFLRKLSLNSAPAADTFWESEWEGKYTSLMQVISRQERGILLSASQNQPYDIGVSTIDGNWLTIMIRDAAGNAISFQVNKLGVGLGFPSDTAVARQLLPDLLDNIFTEITKPHVVPGGRRSRVDETAPVVWDRKIVNLLEHAGIVVTDRPVLVEREHEDQHHRYTAYLTPQFLNTKGVNAEILASMKPAFSDVLGNILERANFKEDEGRYYVDVLGKRVMFEIVYSQDRTPEIQILELRELK